MSLIQTEDIWTIEIPHMGYAGWPTLTKAVNGELLAVYSGGRERHVDPFGQVHLIRSSDGGKNWTWPRVLVDGVLDDRDAGILQTSKSTFIVNWFTSLAWETVVLRDNPEIFKKLPADEQAEWQRQKVLLTDDIRRDELGVWSIRSTDGGITWSQRIPTLVNSPHGPCELSDGRLLYVGRKIGSAAQRINRGHPFDDKMGAAESTDDGQSWQYITDIAPMSGHNVAKYHELHAVQAANGDIIAHIRNHDEPYHFETLQTESKDGGRMWSEPHPIGIYGFPAFLLRAADGRLITTIGHRREPRGNQVSVSEDNGKTWSSPAPINTDSNLGNDFGYPSTVEIAPDTFLTLWYDVQDNEIAQLRLARWKLG